MKKFKVEVIRKDGSTVETFDVECQNECVVMGCAMDKLFELGYDAIDINLNFTYRQTEIK